MPCLKGLITEFLLITGIYVGFFFHLHNEENNNASLLLCRKENVKSFAWNITVYFSYYLCGDYCHLIIPISYQTWSLFMHFRMIVWFRSLLGTRNSSQSIDHSLNSGFKHTGTHGTMLLPVPDYTCTLIYRLFYCCCSLENTCTCVSQVSSHL